MDCPFCAHEDTRVADSRKPTAGRVVRKRVCTACGARFKTTEHLSTDDLQVRKRDGSIEPFHRAKITNGITKAASGQALPPGVVDAFVDRVLDHIAPELPGLPVDSRLIGQLVLENLCDDSHETDVARVRFAMVFLGKRRSGGGGFKDASDVLTWLDENYPDGETDTDYRGLPMEVIKRDGRREEFILKKKLERSIGVAAKGRGDDERVHALATLVGAQVVEELRGQAIVSSQQIADQVLHALLGIDDIAYLRYASITKRYRSRWDLRTEIAAIIGCPTVQA